MKTNEELLKEIEPYNLRMDKLFGDYYERIKSSKSYKRDELPKETAKMPGIYMFLNDLNIPVYVGRTDDIRSRVQYHTREGSKSGSATYAFNCAKIEYEKFKDISKMTRKELDDDIEFKKIFLTQKKIVASHQIKYIQIRNDVLQAMIELYLAVKLKTYPQNQRFENH